MDMNQNLSQLFYIKENVKRLEIEPHSFVRELPSFNAGGNTTIHGLSYKQYFIHPLVTVDTKFILTTTYPGLLTGSGYSHPALHTVEKNDKKDESDFQLGFFFDHTTGMPVIPGSSVKGILKSVFPKKSFTFPDQKLEYIQEITKEITKKDGSFINQTNCERIFFGESPKRKHIFCDAYIEEIPRDGKIFEDDYITPHKKGIFKEPNPIRFLKIAPEIKITFQFVLHDYTDENGRPLLLKNDIAQIFKQIILDFGIGAKRNVGYGNFE